MLSLKKSPPLKGRPELQGDRRLAAHALLLGAMADGETLIHPIPDCCFFKQWISSLRQAGCEITVEDRLLKIWGNREALQSFSHPLSPPDETTLMAAAGLLSAQGNLQQIKLASPFIWGDTQNTLQRLFNCKRVDDNPDMDSPVFSVGEMNHFPASGPRESGMRKAGMLAYQLETGRGSSIELRETLPDCLEKIMSCFGAHVAQSGQDTSQMDELEKRMARLRRQSSAPSHKVTLELPVTLRGCELTLPGDFTSAAIYTLAATLVPGSDIILEKVYLNPARIQFLGALRRMGASIEISGKSGRELVAGTLRIKHAQLKGKIFHANALHGMGDELPLLIIAAAFAKGETVIRDIAHLRQFSGDLLSHMASSLKQAGVGVGELEDGLAFQGRQHLDGQTFDSLAHPMAAFAFLLYGMKAHGETSIKQSQCMRDIYPALVEQLVPSGSA